MAQHDLSLDALTSEGLTATSGGPCQVIACGALARELLAVIEMNGWSHISVHCLPAILHNNPERIPDAVEGAILKARSEDVDAIYVLYADCGTGGLLDNICEKHGVERIAGPHCYAFFSGNDRFAAAGDADMQSFFLTDFLARQFDAFVTKPLGLDRHPELRDMYFSNYKKLVYLAQTDDASLNEQARQHADFLGLAYERRFTGYGDLESAVGAFANRSDTR